MATQVEGDEAGERLVVAEVPFWRHAVTFVASMGEVGASPWCVRWRAPGERRSRLLETFDSEYAARQGLDRYRVIAVTEGEAGVLRESAAARRSLSPHLPRRGRRPRG